MIINATGVLEDYLRQRKLYSFLDGPFEINDEEFSNFRDQVNKSRIT